MTRFDIEGTEEPMTMEGGMAELVIRNVRVFDGVTELGASAVAIADGVITAVGDDVPADGIEVFDGGGGTLLPGLIDGHVHVFDGGLAQALTFGVTTVLDLFCDPPRLARYRAEAAERSDVADLRSAGIGATAPGGHPTQFVDFGVYSPFPTIASEGDAAQWVRDRAGEGSDYIKIFLEDGFCTGHPMPMLDKAAVLAVVAAAHTLGLKTVAHATTLAGLRLAVEAGVDGLAHTIVDELPEPALIDRMLEQGTFVMPTLTPLAFVCGADLRAEYLGETESVRYLDTARQQQLEALPVNPLGAIPGESGPSLDVARESTRRFRDAGVPLIAATDAGPSWPYGISMHGELVRLVEAGLNPSEALAAATSVPAHEFGLDDRGTIVAGKRADLLLVAGDPTRRIADVKNISAVWRGGTHLKREPSASGSA